MMNGVCPGAVSAILGLVSLTASAEKSLMTLDDISKLKHVRRVAVSPDGNHIAFTETVPRNPFQDEDGPAYTYLWVVRGDAPGRLFVGNKTSVSRMRWAPDSSGIYYLAKSDNEKQNALYRIPVDGGASEKLCALDRKRSIRTFDVHPNGRQIALIAKMPEPKHARDAAKKGFDAVVYEENIARSQLSLVTPQPGEPCEPQALERVDHVETVRFSPQGNRLLIKVSPTPHIDDLYMQTRMRILRLDGTETARIENLGKLGPARWSPDGRKVAFLGVDDFNDPSAGRLKVADVQSGTLRDVLPKLEGHVQDMVWLSSDTLAAVIHLGVHSEVWRVQLGSGERSVLVPQDSTVMTTLSASRDGSVVALTGDASDHPAELFRLTENGPQRLTDSNPWLAQRLLGRQTVVNYRAKDGLELQGLLVYPTNYRKGRRYPLLIFVHGGPEAHYSNGWNTNYSRPIQVAAGRGYMSFVPNYRGSTGRGVAFSKLSQNSYATPEFDDIVDGKAHLVKQGLVDRKKVGITGGSYGGYATAWSATALTEHYAAGVMFVGISNQLSKFGTTDIPNEMHAVHSRAWPWDDWQTMLERSPVYHVRKSKTPLLIMHGDADPRVHPAQSLELYRYLKVAGQAPVRLVWYPGEGHGNRRAAARYDYSVRFLRWMDHYLKGPGGSPPPHGVYYNDRLKGDSGS